ncbi:MAG: hypothetical protein FWF08_01590 [Oscillospiraceae bacterium]|nr:hypothetical protein [Oscillospiraceae bacterium]
MKNKKIWSSSVFIASIFAFIFVVVFLGGFKPVSYDLPTVWANVQNGEKVEMFRSSFSWGTKFRSTPMDGFWPTEPYDEITLNVKPQETVAFAAGGSSKILDCEWIGDASGYVYKPSTPEYKCVGRDKNGNITMTAPSEPGEHLYSLSFKFNRGSVVFFVNLFVQE